MEQQSPEQNTAPGQQPSQPPSQPLGQQAEPPQGPPKGRDPRRIFANALATLRLRRREPWHWLLQTLGASLLPLALLTHSAALFVLAFVGILAGCLPLPLPPMQHTELRRLLPTIERLIGLECAWLAKPLDKAKKRQIAVTAVAAPLTAWFLWQQDLGPISLAIVIVYLLRVRRQNIEQGIDP